MNEEIESILQKANPEEIILKLKLIKQILSEEENGNEFTNSSHNRDF